MTESLSMRSRRDPFDRFEDDYVAWLYSLVGRDTDKYGHYWRLIKRLYLHPFYVRNVSRSDTYKDINRVKDGLDLRTRFADDYGINIDRYRRKNAQFDSFFSDDSACSMLEMLVALSLRIRSDIMWDSDDENRVPLWFWSMLNNTGLDLERCSDAYFDENCIVEIAEMCSRIVDRRYEKTGNGSFFPLKNYKKDLRKVELWYQMQFWIGENYPI